MGFDGAFFLHSSLGRNYLYTLYTKCNIMARHQRYVEGGWGWVIVLATFLTEVIIFGTLKALGVLITAMKEDFDTELWVVGSIASLHYGVQSVLTPVAAAVARRVGTRVVVTFGGVLYGVGLLLAALTDYIVVLATALVVISGSGAACALQTTHAQIAFYFKEKYGLAIFVSMTGAPVGIMLYGPVAQVLMDTYGWRGALLLMGGVGFHLVVCGMLMRRPTASYEDTRDYEHLPNDDDDVTENEKAVSQTETNRCAAFVSVLSLDVFLHAEFMILACVRMMCAIGYGGIVVYVVPNGLALGLSTIEASFLTTACGVGMLAGLVLAALVLHAKILSVHSIAAIASITTAIGFALSPFISSFVGQMLNTFVIGAGLDCVLEAVSVMTRCLPFGDDRFVSVLGWQSFLGGVVSSLGDTALGWLSDVTGSLHATFFLFSATMAAVVLCLLIDVLRILLASRSNK